MPTPRRSMASIAVCLVLAACTSTGATPTTGPTGSAMPTALAPTPPPTSEPLATRSPTGMDEPAALVIRAMTCNDVCGPSPGTTVLTDGRVIWRDDSPGGAVLVQRTLTPAGLRSVRDAIDGTGLLDADGSYQPTIRPGADPPGHGTISHGFRVTRDDRLIAVHTTDPGTFEGDNELLGDVWDIPDEAYVLSDLATKLGDIEAWLPADAWTDARRPFEASAYLLIVTAERAGELPPYQEVDAVRWPFQAPIDAVGLPYAEQGEIDPNRRCLPITREVAAALAAAERVADIERTLAAPYSDVSYAWERGPGSVNVALRQLLPDQPVTCENGGAW